MTAPAIERARQLFAAGRPAEARAAAEQLLATDPDDVDALELRALAALQQGDRTTAERTLRHILAVAPQARWAWIDLARLHLDAGDRAAAERVAREALAADPDQPDMHAMLGTFFSEREALPEGAWHYRRALALAGPHPQLAGNLARNLMRQGALEEAAPLAEAAQEAQPHSLAAIALVAEIAERAGDLRRAHAALDRAERIAAAEGRDVLLARATLLSRGENWRDALTLLDGQPELTGGARLLRGRLRDRAGRYQEAWADFTAGKAALAASRGRRYDAAAEEGRAAALAVVPRGLPAAGLRGDVAQPIFVLGMPRSGTTLAEQLLSSHPAIRAGGELPLVPELAAFAAGMTGRDPADLGALAAADHHHLPALFRDYYLARAAVHGLAGPPGTLFTDKMPLNEAQLPLIRLAFPHAPLILLVRHPLDVLVSLMSHDMTHGGECAYRLEDAVHQLALTARLLATYGQAHGIRPYRLVYERFVADQAGETDRLMAALGLATDPAQHRFHENRRHAPTPSHAQVREPVHARSIGRWRNYARELAPILPMVAQAMADGGYAT